MAYAREIVKACADGSCGKTATHAVFNARNSHMGDYCKRHAEARVRSLLREEQRQTKGSETV